MSKKILLKSQKNYVFTMIESAGLQASNFQWVETSGISKLEYKNSDYYFLFDPYQGMNNIKFKSIFSPGFNKYTETEFHATWDEQLSSVALWLYTLKREVEEPDFWGTLAQEEQLFEASMLDNNTSFSLDELSKISKNLNEIKEFLVSTNDFNTKQIDIIISRLDYLEESSKRLGRKDWIMSLIGILSNIIVGIALSPDISKELFKFSGKILSWIFPKPMLM